MPHAGERNGSLGRVFTPASGVPSATPDSGA
jgi:hypothetical protein